MAEPILINGAEMVAQVATITVDNAWAAGDTAVVTCAGKSLTLTVGTDATATGVALAITEMINGTTQTGTGDHTFSNTGTNIPEFTEFTALASGAALTLTGDTKGKPFTVTVSETTVGTGTLGLTLATVAATGKWHWDNADNWSTGAVPVNADTVVLDNRATADILYGLAQSAVTLASLTIKNSFTKKLGLSTLNSDSQSNNYPEYRATYLAIGATLLLIEGEGSGSGRININLGSVASTMTISSRGSAAETNIPAVLIQGTNTANIANISRGDVGFAFYEGESAHLATLNVGFETNQAGDSTVRCGDGVDLGDAVVTQSGGTLTIETVNGTGTTTQSGGTLNVLAGAQATITADGTLNYAGAGTITTLSASGTVDFRQGTGAVTVTNFTLGKGASLFDPAKRVTFTNAIDLYRCKITDLQAFDLGSHLTIQRTTI